MNEGEQIQRNGFGFETKERRRKKQGRAPMQSYTGVDAGFDGPIDQLHEQPKIEVITHYQQAKKQKIVSLAVTVTNGGGDGGRHHKKQG
jgi:hypothetical protein